MLIFFPLLPRTPQLSGFRKSEQTSVHGMWVCVSAADQIVSREVILSCCCASNPMYPQRISNLT